MHMIFADLRKIYRQIYSLGRNWGDFRDEYISPLRQDGPDRILDAGCGQGHLKEDFLRANQRVDYFGVDLAVGDPSWTFQLDAVANLEELPFGDASFDKIISIEVVEHVEEPEKVFREFSRVLRPGGSLFLAAPFVWHLHQEPHDHHRFSQYFYHSVARRFGLEVRSITPMGGYFTVLRYLFSNYSFLAYREEAWAHFLSRILMAVFKIADRLFVAPICYVLDYLDSEKKLTIGYHVHLAKPGVLPPQNLKSPFVCPKCRENPSNELSRGSSCWTCSSCHREYPLKSGVPDFVSVQSEGRSIAPIKIQSNQQGQD